MPVDRSWLPGADTGGKPLAKRRPREDPLSQLLERLKRQQESSSDIVERAELRARIACHYARDGRFDQARQVVLDLRRDFGQGQSGRVTIWTMIAEALVYHYEALSPIALDRISRAQLLGNAMGYSAAIAQASVWKAHIEFERSDFRAMLTSIETAAKHLVESDHDGQTRLAIVLSNAFMLCGDRKESHRWFMRGRDHAVRNGDQPSIDALVYNSAAFVLAWFRTLNCVDKVPKEELRRTRLEIQSAANLQLLMKISALEGHVRLLGARMSILESRYEEAMATLSEVRGVEPFAAHNFDQSFIDLEIAFCKTMIGQVEAAIASSPTTSLSYFAALDIDERIYAAWMLTKMATIDGRFGDSAQYQVQLTEMWTEYESQLVALRAALVVYELG